MKKISLVFAASAVLLAAAGVYANTVATITYYIPSYANRALTGPQCDLTVTPPCTAAGVPQCKVANFYSQEPTVSYQVVVSRIEDSGACTQVKVVQ